MTLWSCDRSVGNLELETMFSICENFAESNEMCKLECLPVRMEHLLQSSHFTKENSSGIISNLNLTPIALATNLKPGGGAN